MLRHLTADAPADRENGKRWYHGDRVTVIISAFHRMFSGLREVRSDVTPERSFEG